MSAPFRKVLIANRGEIAVRIARACAALGITSVAIYSEIDRDSLHVRSCDEAYLIGPAPAAESYLRGDVIVDVARKAGCDAVHPGFGFLSENADFADAVIDAGLTWIGPTPEAIRIMGSKIEAKKLAQQAGVAVVPGYFGEEQTEHRFTAEVERIGYPVLIKASAGGGGKGMRVVERASELREGIEAAKRESQAAFGDDSIMLEKYLREPRHIEVQVLGDNFGNLIHLGERECSIQRRHQKVLEESPSPIVTPEMREHVTGAALALARKAGYSNAGTVEFIYEDGEFYFLEMNTRLQVEHTVTEEALDFDIVEAQFRLAAGERLWIEQEDVEFVGHAIEVRLYAEDPARGFLPSTGKVTELEAPHEEQGVRIDPGVSLGDVVSPFYDPMIAKIITSGESRHDALRRMQEVLGGLRVGGLTTNLDFLRWLVAHPQFEMGNLSTGFIEKYYRPGAFPFAPVQVLLAGGGVRLLADEGDYGGEVGAWHGSGWRLARQDMCTDLSVEGHKYTVLLSAEVGEKDCWKAVVRQGETELFSGKLSLKVRRQDANVAAFDDTPSNVQLQLLGEPLYTLEFGRGQGDELFVVWENREWWLRTEPPLSPDILNKKVRLRDEGTLESPMPGNVLKVLVEKGDHVTSEQPLVIIEAMKMEFTVRAPDEGVVASVNYSEGDQVAVGDVLVEMET